MTKTSRAPVAAALALGLLSFAAAPAAADGGAEPASSGQCAATSFCVWSGTLYAGTFKGTTSTTPVDVSFSPVRSVWNRSSHAARVYSGANGTGSSVCYDPGEQIASASVAAGSVKVLTTSAC